MAFQVDDFARKRRDPTREEALCRWLQTLPEQEARDFVFTLAGADPGVGLYVAKRVIRNPEHAEALMDMGLRKGDATTISWWMEACVPVMGASRLMPYLFENVEQHPIGVGHAIYWLPRYLRVTKEYWAEHKRLRGLVYERQPDYPFACPMTDWKYRGFFGSGQEKR